MINHKIIKNVLSALFGSTSTAALTFISIPMLVKGIGVEDYGKLAILLSTQIIFQTLFSFQPWQALIKFWYNEKYKKKNILSYAILMDILSCSIGVISLYFFLNSSLFADMFFYVEKQVVVFLSIAMIFNINSIFIGMCRIGDEFLLIAFSDFLRAFTRFIGAFLVMKSGNLSDYIFWFFVSGFTSFIIYPLIKFNVLMMALGNVFKLDTSDIKPAINFCKFSFFVALKSIIDLPVQHMDKYLVSYLLGNASVAVFDVSKRINQGFGVFINVANQVFFPKVSAWLSVSPSHLIWYKGVKISFTLATFVITMCMLSYCIDDIVFVYYNEIFDMNESSYYFSKYYTSVFLISSSFIFIHIFFLAKGYVKQDVKFLVFTNCIYLLLCFFGMKYFGLYSIVIAYAFQVISVLAFKFIYTNNKIKEVTHE
ncbi:lipopolysaccharide biosynthesis protein [Vibrio alginolyticus]|uniref:lipopolysaccharide biosynthesis protein n=1 Tax=Vibrio alginolyticus TaxID=663 RepID=UPI00215F1266|nr:oligosaccharide flippase family protein [Vibrio alginolyticus]MCS0164746.1 oligosaccharide flippase family protein [Vibrio alginolyticus]